MVSGTLSWVSLKRLWLEGLLTGQPPGGNGELPPILASHALPAVMLCALPSQLLGCISMGAMKHAEDGNSEWGTGYLFRCAYASGCIGWQRFVGGNLHRWGLEMGKVGTGES